MKRGFCQKFVAFSNFGGLIADLQLPKNVTLAALRLTIDEMCAMTMAELLVVCMTLFCTCVMFYVSIFNMVQIFRRLFRTALSSTVDSALFVWRLHNGAIFY